jgi:hypothetical protein
MFRTGPKSPDSFERLYALGVTFVSTKAEKISSL